MSERITALHDAFGIVSELDLSATSAITPEGYDWIERIECQLDRMLWDAYRDDDARVTA